MLYCTARAHACVSLPFPYNFVRRFIVLLKQNVGGGGSEGENKNLAERKQNYFSGG